MFIDAGDTIVSSMTHTEQHAHHRLMANDKHWRVVPLELNDDGLETLDEISVRFAAVRVSIAKLVALASSELVCNNAREAHTNSDTRF